MTLSPTALEEAAKAYRDVTFNALTLDECRDASSAAITAYLAQAGKEGLVMVPKEPSDKMVCAALDDYDKRGRGKQSYANIYHAMIAAAQNGGE